MSELLSRLDAAHSDDVATNAMDLLGSLIQKDQYVGELYSIGYESALVQIHDFQRQQVGGIPSLCFLVATRIRSSERFDYTKEDASVILLRVLDSAALPNDKEAERIRAEAAQRSTGGSTHWDEREFMDGYTANLLSFAGVKCRVLGTFYLDEPKAGTTMPTLRFGSDLSNYYPNKGLKVYKPNEKALERIVNYRDPNRPIDHPLADQQVTVGEVRYASTNRGFQGVSNVPVSIVPTDLLAQKSALFGMTRTGKSNTVKIIAKAIFELRFLDHVKGRVGQLIFDPNGEYANENVQDKGALKNVWKSDSKGKVDDVVTYGTTAHPLDPARKLLLLNFYLDTNLQTGKEMINTALENERGTKYIGNFLDVTFELPSPTDRSATIRFNRRALVYRTLLHKAGLHPPAAIKPNTTGLFNINLLAAMRSCNTGDNDVDSAVHSAERILSNAQPTWAQMEDAMEGLRIFIAKGNDTGYNAFNDNYRTTSSTGDNWHDALLLKVLGMFEYANGSRLVGRIAPNHSSSTSNDYAEEIYKDLIGGKLVVVDQATGDEDINKQVAERIMWRIFRGNFSAFTQGKAPPELVAYMEEAHNLLPAGNDLDMRSVWVRTAKEGGKCRIGMVYSTQEASSIHKSILKATANWFVGHLNNQDETREISKYYDFADFVPSILRAQDKGFLRVKTQSNMFVLPVQIQKFEL